MQCQTTAAMTVLFQLWCAIFTDFPEFRWTKIIDLADFLSKLNRFFHLNKKYLEWALKICRKNILSLAVLSLRTFCPHGHFVPPAVLSRRTFCLDVLSLQMFCPWTLCLRTLCLCTGRSSVQRRLAQVLYILALCTIYPSP
jgi:hypothetical protein